MIRPRKTHGKGEEKDQVTLSLSFARTIRYRSYKNLACSNITTGT